MARSRKRILRIFLGTWPAAARPVARAWAIPLVIGMRTGRRRHCPPAHHFNVQPPRSISASENDVEGGSALSKGGRWVGVGGGDSFEYRNSV